MKTHECTLRELNERGLRALVRALGPAGMARFLGQFEVGSGDYTKDRRKWLEGVTSDEVAQALLHRQGEGKPSLTRPRQARRKTK